MSDDFDITVTYKGKQQIFPATFSRLGYSYKIFVSVNNSEIIFEPDEERNFRAIASQDAMHNQHIDTALIKAIGEALQEAFK
ncbi:MAG: hypothetical protein ABI687_13565 [Flavitalea sp.]